MVRDDLYAEGSDGRTPGSYVLDVIRMRDSEGFTFDRQAWRSILMEWDTRKGPQVISKNWVRLEAQEVFAMVAESNRLHRLHDKIFDCARMAWLLVRDQVGSPQERQADIQKLKREARSAAERFCEDYKKLAEWKASAKRRSQEAREEEKPHG